MKCYVNEVKIKNKKVILRVDYNVPVIDGVIADTKKIDDTFQTIDYLLSENCKIIILSHFGRVKDESDKQKNSLLPVFEYLKSLNKYNIVFSSEPMGSVFENIVNNLAPKQIALIENTRFLDLNNNLESKCDIQLSMYYSSFADYYINDAFASMHRNHTSITGIPKYLPSAFGFLVKKELENLKVVTTDIKRPFVVVMGGAKLDDKIPLAEKLLEKADYVLFGGGIANTFLKAAGFDIGASLTSKDGLVAAYKMLEKYRNKIILPKDVIVSPSFSNDSFKIKKIDDIVMDDIIGDIGLEALNNYSKILNSAKTIFINGTIGKYEQKEFANGTRMLLEEIGKTNAIKIVGGGDAAASVKKFKLENQMSFISTGGGAALSYIANGTLPGIDAVINNILKRPVKKVFVNLKDWFNLKENEQYVQKIIGSEAVFFPANPYLYLYKDKNLELGLQNISVEEKGAHTGEISLEHLKDFDIKWALLNHRELKKEDINTLKAKINLLANNNIKIIFCMENVSMEIHEYFKTLFDGLNYKDIYIAYEPLSTGNETKEEIYKKFDSLKQFLNKVYPDYKTAFGGNITLESIKEISSRVNADAYLISKDALNPEKLDKIIDLLNY